MTTQTTHLTDEERIDALDDLLDQARAGHLDQCAECRAALEGLRAVMQAVAVEAGQDPVPDPGDAFWRQMPTRIGHVVAPSPMGRSYGWIGLAAALLVLAIGWGTWPRPDVAPVTTVADLHLDEVFEDTPQWVFVTGVLETLADEDVHDVLRPSRDGLDAALAALGPEEREELARLLQAELTEGSES